MAGPSREQRQRNLRTALVMVSIALVFFVGVIVDHWMARQAARANGTAPAAAEHQGPAGSQQATPASAATAPAPASAAPVGTAPASAAAATGERR